MDNSLLYHSICQNHDMTYDESNKTMSAFVRAYSKAIQTGYDLGLNGKEIQTKDNQALLRDFDFELEESEPLKGKLEELVLQSYQNGYNQGCSVNSFGSSQEVGRIIRSMACPKRLTILNYRCRAKYLPL